MLSNIFPRRSLSSSVKGVKKQGAEKFHCFHIADWNSDIHYSLEGGCGGEGELRQFTWCKCSERLWSRWWSGGRGNGFESFLFGRWLTGRVLCAVTSLAHKSPAENPPRRVSWIAKKSPNDSSVFLRLSLSPLASGWKVRIFQFQFILRFTPSGVGGCGWKMSLLWILFQTPRGHAISLTSVRFGPNFLPW